MYSFNALDGIQYGARGHIGQRKENQDDIRLPDLPGNGDGGGQLFAVAEEELLLCRKVRRH